jgi:glycerol-3-phosphate O-acyltransferase
MLSGRVVLIALSLVAGYELARWVVLRRVRDWLHRRSRREAAERGTRIDLFKFGGKLLVREELLNDLVVTRAMLAASQSGERPEEVRRRVEHYIDEIVPAFSLTAYYQFGMRLARTIIHAVYRPVIDAQSVKRVSALPPDATPVFVINHRSNFDYVVVAFALERQVAVSYAVGEWARIFPLDALFKAFGGFFVRRGFPDPLYHTVLRRYLQLITRRGVTQGIFLEGGLTRDGALRSPKVGLLDGLIQLASEPDFNREVYFVPVGINYDRVLEDTSLLAEQRGRDHPPSRLDKLLSALRLIPLVPWRIIVNGVRVLTGRLQRAGYVAVAFGEPLRWKDAAASLGVGPGLADDDGRRRDVSKQVASALMDRIAKTIPATPVTLVARALQGSTEALTRSELATRVAALRTELHARGAPTALGAEFDRTRTGRAELDEGRSRETAALEGHLLDAEEAEAIVELGVERLAHRGIVRVLTEGRLAVDDAAEAHELIAYYARSLAILDRPVG